MKKVSLNIHTMEFIIEDYHNTVRVATGIGRWAGSNGYGLYCICNEDKVSYWKRRLINKRVKESKDNIKDEKNILARLSKLKETVNM